MTDILMGIVILVLAAVALWARYKGRTLDAIWYMLLVVVVILIAAMRVLTAS